MKEEVKESCNASSSRQGKQVPPQEPTNAAEHGGAPPSNSSKDVDAPQLRHFLLESYIPSGAHLLAPFLAVPDLLRLSSCCHRTMNYRNVMGKALTIADNRAWSAPITKAGALEAFVPSASAIIVKSPTIIDDIMHSLLLQPPPPSNLLSIELATDRWSDHQLKAMVSLLKAHQFKSLEKLVLTAAKPSTQITIQSIQDLTTALSSGTWPHLHELSLCGVFQESGDPDLASQALAHALLSGHVSHLHKLDLSNYALGYGGTTRVLEALGDSSCCPDLRELNLNAALTFTDEFMALSRLLQSDACGQLEVLNVNDNQIMDPFFVEPICQAIRFCHLPCLRELHLQRAVMGVEGATALARALRTKRGHQLEVLNLRNAFGPPGSATLVLNSIHAGTTPNLMQLDLQGNRLGNQDGMVLAHAMAARVLTKASTSG